MSRFETVSGVATDELAKPYAYGEADCFMLGCRIIDAIQGTEHADTYGGRYSTLAGAQKSLRKEKCKSLVEFFRDRIGMPEKAAAHASIGDLAILDLGGAEHVAFFNGRTFTTKTETGAQSFGFDAVKACFKV